MKLKLAKNSLFAVLLRSPWWVSLCLVAAIAAAAWALLPPAHAPYGVLGASPFLVIAALAARRQWRQPSPTQVEQTLQRLAAMNWQEAAAAVDAGLRRDGYAPTALAGHGADFTAERAGRTVLISCKRWKAASIGIEPLRALHTALEAADASEGWYLAIGSASAAAQRFAGEHRLRLVQGVDLVRLVGSSTQVKG